MEMHQNVSMDIVFNCVLEYLQDVDDRNAISLVSRELYKLDCMTRKHVTIHMFYSPTPSRLHERFPCIASLTLKGLPRFFKSNSTIDIAPWIQEVSVSFVHLKALHIFRMDVHDSDLELLARTRGKDLQVLKIIKCKGFSTDGLLHIGKYCNDLRAFCLKRNKLVEKNLKWFNELALRNRRIESLHINKQRFEIEAKDLVLLAKNCSQSLLSLKINWVYRMDILDVFKYAFRLEKFACQGYLFGDKEYVGFKFPSNIRCLNIYDLTKTLILPFAHQLKELNLFKVSMDVDSQCFLIQRCPNLEVLYSSYEIGDEGFQVIGQYCRKLRKLRVDPHDSEVTEMGLINVVQGCLDLECLHVIIIGSITNETLELIGTHLKNLREFSMYLRGFVVRTSLPLDNGIRAMLIGCNKLEKLHLGCLLDSGLTDLGLEYIGKYGHNLRCLFLEMAGDSYAGLVELSKGCPKLRKLELLDGPLIKQAGTTCVFNIHSLRYTWLHHGIGGFSLEMTRP